MTDLLLILSLHSSLPGGLRRRGGPPPSDPLRQVRLPMGYIPNVQFAPLYVAIEKGYFARPGIEMQFDYTFETDGVLAGGRRPASVLRSSRASRCCWRAPRDCRWCTSCAWYQDFPVSVIAAPELGITTPADLKGKNIGLPGCTAPATSGCGAAVQRRRGRRDVSLDAIGFNQVEALAAGAGAGGRGLHHQRAGPPAAQGVEFTEVRVADYLQLVSNGLITNEKTLQENPELVRGMVRALPQGHSGHARPTRTRPTRSARNTWRTWPRPTRPSRSRSWPPPSSCGRPTSRATPTRRPGRTCNDLLVDMGLLTEPQDLSKAFTNDFIPQGQ